MHVVVKQRALGDGHPTYVIAEMACSHEGNCDIARHLVDVAADSGSDAVQFQIISVDDYIVPQHPDYGLYCRLEFKPEEWRGLFRHAQQRGLAVFAAAYDRPSADLASACGVDAYKLHSADLSNPYLTQYIAAKGRPVTLGTGGSTIGEIADGIQMLREAGAPGIILMHGFQNFPTRWEEIHLRYMASLKRLFNVPVGYQDHTDGESELGFVLPMVAVGLGANVLEKHFTHDRSQKGVDHESALNPDELKRFVQRVKEVDAAMGQASPHPLSSEEQKYRTYAKKSVVAARDIRAGETISAEMLVFKRSKPPGLAPILGGRFVGQVARRDIAVHTNVTEDMLERHEDLVPDHR